MSNTTSLDEMNMDRENNNKGYGGGVIWLLWFIVIVIVIWLILFATKPTWVQKTCEDGKPTGEVDSGKALLWAIVITIIICVLVWIFTTAGRGGYGGYGRKY